MRWLGGCTGVECCLGVPAGEELECLSGAGVGIWPAWSNTEALAAHLDATPTALALGWLLSRPGVTAPVLGPPLSSS